MRYTIFSNTIHVPNVSDPDPHSLNIRIRIPNADPDPGGLKRAENEGGKRIQKADY
jgi:hypothetical protein